MKRVLFLLALFVSAMICNAQTIQVGKKLYAPDCYEFVRQFDRVARGENPSNSVIREYVVTQGPFLMRYNIIERRGPKEGEIKKTYSYPDTINYRIVGRGVDTIYVAHDMVSNTDKYCIVKYKVCENKPPERCIISGTTVYVINLYYRKQTAIEEIKEYIEKVFQGE